MPRSWRSTPAGLQRGPRILKTVRVPNALRAPMAYFMAGCKEGANMKPMPIFLIHSDTFSGGKVMSTPNAVSTSADPDLEVIERLPCLATGTPAPATTKEAAVDILKVPLASPPVPHMSMASSTDSILVILSRIAWAKPAISADFSPFARSAMRKPAIWASSYSPDIILNITSRDSSWVRLWLPSNFSIVFFIFIPLKNFPPFSYHAL